MDRDSAIYFEHFEAYEHCPQMFLWGYGWDGVDCGGGYGQPKPRPEPPYPRESLLIGEVIRACTTQLYNNELWRDPKRLTANMEKVALREWRQALRKPENAHAVRASKSSPQELFDVVREGAAGYVRTMKRHRLLTSKSRSKVHLLGQLNKWLTVGSYADILLRSDKAPAIILEGTSTRYKLRWANPDKLRWHAMTYWRTYRELPGKLGFVWHRFPAGMLTKDPESGEDLEEEGVHWVEFDPEDIHGLAVRANEARNGMRKRKFEPTPSPKTCKYCKFQSACEARLGQKRRNSRGPSPSEIPEAEGSKGGFVDFSL